MQKNSESGVVTIEASLALLFFIPAVLSILSFSLLVFTQARVQQALQQAAKDVGKYYYVITRAGFNLANPSQNDNSGTDRVLGNLSMLYSALQDTGSTVQSLNNGIHSAQGMDDVIDSVEGFQTNIAVNVSTVETAYNSLAGSLAAIDDPIAVIKALASTGGQTAGSHALAALIGRLLFSSYIQADSGIPADTLLRSMGVKDGLDGMKLFGSSLVADGQTVNIVVSYTIKLPFSIWDFDSYTVTQAASTQAWIYRAQQ